MPRSFLNLALTQQSTPQGHTLALQDFLQSHYQLRTEWLGAAFLPEDSFWHLNYTRSNQEGQESPGHWCCIEVLLEV